MGLFLFAHQTVRFYIGSWLTSKAVLSEGGKKVKHQQKEAIQKLRIEGQSYTKIASILGISENTVKSYCRRNNLAGVVLVSPDPVTVIYCRQCGSIVNQKPGKKQKRYCSDQCRMTWWNAHPEAATRKSVQRFTCKTCNLDFQGYGNRARKYCSRACYGKSKVVLP